MSRRKAQQGMPRVSITTPMLRPCPYCGAQPGSVCVYDGAPAGYTHTERNR